jgi:hypothetical protein
MSVWIDFKDVLGLSFIALLVVGYVICGSINLVRRKLRGKPACSICGGARMVCEHHRDTAWPDDCHCGAGMPCPLCAQRERG